MRPAVKPRELRNVCFCRARRRTITHTSHSNTPTVYWPISAVNMFNSAACPIYYSADASFQQLVQTRQPQTSSSESQAVSGSPPRKSKFCAFMAAQCDKPIYPADAALRSALFDLMAERYQPCDALGKCRSSVARENLAERSGSRPGSAIEKVQPYRFVVSFENMLMPGKTSLNSMPIPGTDAPSWVAGLTAQPGTSPAVAKVIPRIDYYTHRAFSLALPTPFAESAHTRDVPGYISERVPQTLLADGVPIYFGDFEELAKHVNLNRVIACEGFTPAKLRLFRADVGGFNPKQPEHRIDAAKVCERDGERKRCVCVCVRGAGGCVGGLCACVCVPVRESVCEGEGEGECACVCGTTISAEG